ncbi:phospholipase D family protein [Yersinia mollaretii]|uniref:phospholipase D n=1 Tax=Yersinia mollaretii TaxID=33060 RepID=A0AA44CI84_YERMO|nr:phospholipase D family protein [Yersinia mollaretii]NIL21205.1 phospholipase D family protein [Yersinia mollaretii]CNI25292.1 endonuclease [Yersinia mollaretii]CQQ30394.1 endonuclease [Yersinia mollaretii]
MNYIKYIMFVVAISFPVFSFAAPDVQVGFSPEGSARALVLKVINSAHKSIQMIGYSFQAPDIAKVLIAARERGVDVRVVVDKRRNQVKASKTTMLYVANNGIKLRVDSHYHIQHDKTIIVDGQTVETGSFNFAPSAETENSENVVVIRGMPKVVQQFVTHWNSRWDRGIPFKPIMGSHISAS